MSKLMKICGGMILVLVVTAACSTAATPAATVAPASVPTAASTMVMAVSTSAASMGMPMTAPITQSITTTSYKLNLTLGPVETMLTPDQAKTATSGEVMVGGQMAMDMSGMTPNYHLEVHVSDIQSSAVITNQAVSIQVINAATKQSEDVPIAVMYGVAEGPSDTHFGNNVDLTTGSYTIAVKVGSESGEFKVTIP